MTSEDNIVSNFAARYPERWKLMLRMMEVQTAKGHDYSGQQKDDLENLRASEEMGIPAWVGVLIRMNDKMTRLKNFAKSNILQVKDEQVEDTLLDLAVYSFLNIILYRESSEPLEARPSVGDEGVNPRRDPPRDNPATASGPTCPYCDGSGREGHGELCSHCRGAGVKAVKTPSVRNTGRGPYGVDR